MDPGKPKIEQLSCYSFKKRAGQSFQGRRTCGRGSRGDVQKALSPVAASEPRPRLCALHGGPAPRGGPPSPAGTQPQPGAGPQATLLRGLRSQAPRLWSFLDAEGAATHRREFSGLQNTPVGPGGSITPSTRCGSRIKGRGCLELQTPPAAPATRQPTSTAKPRIPPDPREGGEGERGERLGAPGHGRLSHRRRGSTSTPRN